MENSICDTEECNDEATAATEKTDMENKIFVKGKKLTLNCIE
jgi:hypothetical protein